MINLSLTVERVEQGGADFPNIRGQVIEPSNASLSLF
jgi:hypothetical protein